MASEWDSIDVVEIDGERFILQQRKDPTAAQTHEEVIENHRLVVLDDVEVIRDPEDARERLWD